LPFKKLNSIRPTTDFVKEALFNYLQCRISFHHIRVLELFAGTGHIGFEFLSRGAENVTFVDHHVESIHFIRLVMQHLQIPPQQVMLRKADVETFLMRETPVPYDLIFMDPPYQYPKIPYLLHLIFSRGWLKLNGFLIVEHKRGVYLANLPYYVETRNYGRSALSLFVFQSQDQASTNPAPQSFGS
jgi:16S rRNA (guanine(966)-N(2))-methyltransferase RsmD